MRKGAVPKFPSNTVNHSCWHFEFPDHNTEAEIGGTAGLCKNSYKLYRPTTGWTQFNLANYFHLSHSINMWFSWKRRAIKIKNVETLTLRKDCGFFPSALYLSCPSNFPSWGGRSPGPSTQISEWNLSLPCFPGGRQLVFPNRFQL